MVKSTVMIVIMDLDLGLTSLAIHNAIWNMKNGKTRIQAQRAQFIWKCGWFSINQFVRFFLFLSSFGSMFAQLPIIFWVMDSIRWIEWIADEIK